MPPGRKPHAWNPQVEERLFAALRAGNYLQVAAAHAGIARDTVYLRMRKGARAKSGADFDFRQEVERATADAETRNVAYIAKAAAESWKAASWYLERKFPDRWGRRDHVTVLKQLAEEVEQLSDDELLALVASGRSTPDETR